MLTSVLRVIGLIVCFALGVYLDTRDAQTNDGSEM